MKDIISEEKYRDILEEAIELEDEKKELQEENDEDYPMIEWSAQTVHASPQSVMKLVQEKLVDVAYERSSGPNLYRLHDRESMREVVERYKSIEEAREARSSGDVEDSIPDDLFAPIVGYEDVKDMFMRSIEGGRVHILLVGEPGTAKTLFLEELDQLPASYFIETGGRTSKAGLSGVVFQHKPRYLMIDEITDMDNEAYSVLKPLMESGRVDETIVGGEDKTQLDSRVYATTNYYDKIPYEIQSRFVPFYFDEYEHEEFIEICINYLRIREDMDNEEIARYVGQKVWENENVPDIRTARSVIRLLREETKEDVDEVIETIKRYEVR